MNRYNKELKMPRFNPYSVEQQMLRYNITREEAEKKIQQIKINRKESNPYSVEYLMKKRGFTREEAEDYVKELKKKTATGHLISDPEWQMEKFGLSRKDAEAKIQDAYRRRGESTSAKKKERPASHFNTTEYWISKGYSSEEALIKKAEHIENMQAAFHKELKSNPKKYRGRTPLELEYWTNRGFSLEDAKTLRKERQSTFTLKKCIEKYGKSEGLAIWKRRQTVWLSKLKRNFTENGDSRSPQSVWAKNIIKKCCESLSIEIPKKEKWITSKKDDFRCSYDFTYENKIIELHGDFWHANPKIFAPDDIIPVIKITAKEKWNLDKRKKELAESFNYKVLVIWESEYHENQEQTINKCIEFLNSKK